MVEYVPTQVVSEYFRTIFARDYGVTAQGLLYGSAANEGGICCALFVEREHCVDEERGDGQSVLVLASAETRDQVPTPAFGP